MIRRTKEAWEMMTPGKHKLVVSAGILITLMLAAVAWSILRNMDAEPVSYDASIEAIEEDPDSIEALDVDPDSLPAPNTLNRAVLERHFAAIGGVKRLSSIHSLLVLGEVNLPDGETMSFVIAKKRGERIRVSTKQKNSTVVMSSTPEDAWRSIRVNGELVRVEDISNENRENIRRSSYIVSELFLAMNNSWTIEYLGQQAFDYRMAHCYEVKADDGHFIRFYIDPETYLGIGREERIFTDDGTLKLTRLLTSDYMDISGLVVPAKTETYVDGELLQTFFVKDVEVNPGILDSSFARPEMPAASGN